MQKTLLLTLLAAAALACQSSAADTLLYTHPDTITTGASSATAYTLTIPTANQTTMIGGWTLTFDITFTSSTAPWASVFTVGEGSNFCYGLNYGKAAGGWSLVTQGYGVSGVSTTQCLLPTTSGETVTCTFIMAPGAINPDSNKVESALSFYVGNTLAASATGSAATYGGQGNPGKVDTVVFGAGVGFSNPRYTEATFSNIKLYEGVVAPSVPEPATATLSLLALAGLTARRRRK